VIKEHERIILFGAGKNCRAFLDFIKKYNLVYDILAIADNDIEKQHKTLEGINIISPSEINNYDYVYISTTYILQVREQLINCLGIPENKIKIVPKCGIDPHKSYRAFEDPATKDVALNTLLTLADLFNKNNITYFVDNGTLLGLIREGDLLPWDDDIDITAFREDYLKILNVIKSNFLTSDQKIKWALNLVYDKNKDPLIIQLYFETNSEEYRNFIIDINLLRVENGVAIQNLTYSPIYYFLKNDIIRMFDIDISVPYDYISYLEHHYGDWRKPKKDTSFYDMKNFKEPDSTYRERIV